MDPIDRLADEKLRELAIDLEVQLERRTAHRPVLFMLHKAREKAGKAMVMFLDVDPTDAKLITRLQAEVKLYDDMITSCRELVARGREAQSRIAENERSAIEELVINMTDEERRLHKLEPRGTD